MSALRPEVAVVAKSLLWVAVGEEGEVCLELKVENTLGRVLLSLLVLNC